MDLSLTAEQQRFIDEKLKTGKYKTAADVVRDSVRIWMVQEAADQQRQAGWASEVREKIEAGWQQSERGEMVDGEEVFRRLKKQLEDRADPKRP